MSKAPKLTDSCGESPYNISYDQGGLRRLNLAYPSNCWGKAFVVHNFPHICGAASPNHTKNCHYVGKYLPTYNLLGNSNSVNR